MITEILLVINILLLMVAVVLLVLLRSKRDRSSGEVIQVLSELQTLLKHLESLLREEFRISREESARTLRENREEISRLNRENREELTNRFNDFSTNLNQQLEKSFQQTLDRIKELTQQARADSLQLREDTRKEIKEFQETFERNVRSFNDLQREKFDQLSEDLRQKFSAQEDKLREKLGQIEQQQKELVETTEKKLEQMRETVDEKLQKTLNERLSQSFETVGKQLQAVQEGLGEMRNLAQDVGGLKKVLSNVKVRGGLGEVQLAMLLEQFMAPGQYEANVVTKKGSNERVEFAIKLPGPDEGKQPVYLPIDAKFPKETYEHLVEAYESGDPALIETASKNLENTIRKMARDIHDKYIDPPRTTDFAIMFLPFEGIYAEVIRRTELLEQLGRNFKVAVTGPTTLTAFLNSLQMGFRTLTIQKRSSEVWKILSDVKNEFEKFGNLLEKAHKQITDAGQTIEDLRGKRTRAIQRKLSNVAQLPEAETEQQLKPHEEEYNEEEFSLT